MGFPKSFFKSFEWRKKSWSQAFVLEKDLAHQIREELQKLQFRLQLDGFLGLYLLSKFQIECSGVLVLLLKNLINRRNIRSHGLGNSYQCSSVAPLILLSVLKVLNIS